MWNSGEKVGEEGIWGVEGRWRRYLQDDSVTGWEVLVPFGLNDSLGEWAGDQVSSSLQAELVLL